MRPSSNRHVLAKVREAIGGKEQWRLAKLAGCSVETIRKVEKGKMKLSEPLALKISNATGVDFKWLMANKLNSEIAPSMEARVCDLLENGRYTLRTFELIRTRRAEQPKQTTIPGGNTFSADDPKIWPAVLKGEKEQQNRQIAEFRLESFIEGLKQEFGPKVVASILARYAKKPRLRVETAKPKRKPRG